MFKLCIWYILFASFLSGCVNPERAMIEHQEINRAPHSDFGDLRYEGRDHSSYKNQTSVKLIEDDLDELQLAKAKKSPYSKPQDVLKLSLPEIEQRITAKKASLDMAKIEYEKDLAQRDGIFSCEDSDADTNPCITAKLRGKPLISIIDEAARMRRFNYTVTTDISRFYVDIFDDSDVEQLIKFKMHGYTNWKTIKQKKFQSVDEFVMQLIQRIKDSYQDADDQKLKEAAESLSVRWLGDGFLFYDKKHDPEEIKPKITTSLAQDKPAEQADKNQSKPAINVQSKTDNTKPQPVVSKLDPESPECIKILKKAKDLNRTDPSKAEDLSEPCNGRTLDQKKNAEQSYQTENKKQGPDLSKPSQASTGEPHSTSGEPHLPDGETSDSVTFKKIFLFNLSEKEVAYYLSRLFGLPYNDYSPDYSARQLTQYISLADGKLLDKSTPPVPGVPTDAPAATGKEIGSMISLPQQNAIIVKGSYEMLQKISQMLYSIDSEYRQVLIEAKVFEYDNSISKKIGNTLNGTKTMSGNTSGTYGITNKGLENEFGADVAAALPNFFMNLSDAERRFSLLNTLAYYDRDGLVRITAEPHLLVKPGQESIIDLSVTKYVQVGAQQTGTQSVNIALATLKEVPTGVVLVIRPTLLSDNKIQLDFILRQSEFAPSQEKEVLLATNSNQVLSSVVVNDGELVTIGGIETQKFNHARSGIPSIKDVPYFGNLFGAKSTEFQSTKVEFMIRPTIKNIGYRRHQLHESIVEKEYEAEQFIRKDIGLDIGILPLSPNKNDHFPAGVH
jgi:type II secretory pathway component GspD/PulD (secretin)